MQPDDQNKRRMGTPLTPQRSFQHTSNSSQANHTDAAANVVRGQLDRIYDGETDTPTPQTTPVPIQEPAPQPIQESKEDTNPYHRTQQQGGSHQIQAEQWKQYHSAWQDYYQKYYERYYVGQVYRAQQALESKVSSAITATEIATPDPQNSEGMTKKEAIYDLKNKLKSQLQESAVKARESRHFVPITAALCVMLVFLFLQYNRVLFANVQAYVSPGNIDPANIIIDPNSIVAVGKESQLIIPKINVDAPIIFDTTPDQKSQNLAMSKGVSWFGVPGANSKPGQIGNTVLSGHSSNDITDGGNFKFVFVRLEKIQKGDTIYINYKGKRYVYSVTKKDVVKPDDVSSLVYKTDKPVLTLITCTPLGTALNRLLVTAEQISPDPKAAAVAPIADPTDAPADIPGNSPTFLQKIGNFFTGNSD